MEIMLLRSGKFRLVAVSIQRGFGSGTDENCGCVTAPNVATGFYANNKEFFILKVLFFWKGRNILRNLRFVRCSGHF